VHACHAATGLPIVGMGGVSSGRDVVELVACGATHVALGTVLFADPDAPARIRGEVTVELERLAVASLDDIFGRAHDYPQAVEKPLQLGVKTPA
jgi:dihydroorotate dehydrogenase (NAD+) catalytic subunit